MTAGEDQLEPVIGDGLHVALSRAFFGARLGRASLVRDHALQLLSLRREAPLPPQPVDGLVAGRRGDPRARVVGDPPARPPLQGHREGLLDCLLGQVEVAERPDERGNGSSPFLAKDATGEVPRIRYG